MIIFLLILLGLVWGSFVNAFIWRFHEGKDWLWDRSECQYCHHQLAVRDLVPVVSWLLLRGRCRYCYHHIDDSPLVEIVMPLLFLASYAWWPLPLNGAGLFQFILWLLFIVGFVALAAYDIRWYILPNKIVYPLIALAALQLLVLVFWYGAGWTTILAGAAGVTIISGTFYVLFQISKGRWIGGGDVKLGIMLGLLSGGAERALLLLFLASLVGTIAMLPLMVRGRLKPKAVVPFGPFLLLASVIVQLFGAHIISWYMGLSSVT
ncbi:MAG TPA: prepilin peptidase [Candidatus Saccharimonadales bacterium]|nr:prepilin peptidase [Candidatus Saccharimonadales bacterium]